MKALELYENRYGKSYIEVNGIPALFNPKKQDVIAFRKIVYAGELRGIVMDNGDLFVWPASTLTHFHFASRLERAQIITKDDEAILGFNIYSENIDIHDYEADTLSIVLLNDVSKIKSIIQTNPAMAAVIPEPIVESVQMHNFDMLINPTYREFQKFKLHDNEVRGIILYDGTVYVWQAGEMIHDTFIKKLISLGMLQSKDQVEHQFFLTGTTLELVFQNGFRQIIALKNEYEMEGVLHDIPVLKKYFPKYVKESYPTVMNMDSVLVNPSSRELRKRFVHDLRGVVLKDRTVYIWSGYDLIHSDFIKVLWQRNLIEKVSDVEYELYMTKSLNEIIVLRRSDFDLKYEGSMDDVQGMQQLIRDVPALRRCFPQYVKESYSIEGMYASVVSDPTYSQFKKTLEKYKSIRGVILSDGTVYIWNSMDMIHNEFTRRLAQKKLINSLEDVIYEFSITSYNSRPVTNIKVYHGRETIPVYNVFTNDISDMESLFAGIPVFRKYFPRSISETLLKENVFNDMTFVLVNPSLREFNKEFNDYAIRGIVLKDGTVYFWNAYEMIHHDFIKKLLKSKLISDINDVLYELHTDHSYRTNNISMFVWDKKYKETVFKNKLSNRVALERLFKIVPQLSIYLKQFITEKRSPIIDIRPKRLDYSDEIEVGHQTGRDLNHEWWTRLTSDEKLAIRWYRDHGYSSVADAIYKGVIDHAYDYQEDMERQLSVEETISLLDQAIGKSSFETDVVVYRGLKDEGTVEYVNQFNVGDVFTINGFVSTTIGIHYAAVFSTLTRKAPYPVIMRIFIPKYTPAAYISYDDNEEREVLLGRNRSFKVISKKITTTPNPATPKVFMITVKAI